VLAISAAVWVLLLIPVDRFDDHLELRELPWWQVAAIAFGIFGSAGTVYLATQYGPWSVWTLVRRYGRDLALVHLSLSLVVTLYLVSLLFR
jgi:hypothetical protein